VPSESENKTIELKLSQPIQAHGETVEVLKFRPPRGKDLRVAGLIFDTSADPTDPSRTLTRFNLQAVANLICTLAGIPMSSVDALSAGDFTAAMGVIAGFFGDGTPVT